MTARRVGEDRVLRPDELRRSSADSRVRPADLQEPALFLDVLEARDAADVHEVAGRAEAQLQERQQALAAREHLRVVAVAATSSPIASESVFGEW